MSNNNSAFMENLRQLFAECDTDKNGSLGREEFTELCSKIGLTKDAAQETFDRLDIDKNDRITFDEFAAGFNQYSQSKSTSPGGQPKPAAQVGNNKSRPESPTVVSAPPRASPVLSGRGKLSPVSNSATAISRARKSASPLGVLSLGSTGSSSNLTSGGGAGGGNAADMSASSCEFSVDGSPMYANYTPIRQQQQQSLPSADGNNDVVIYSSDSFAGADQASGSGSQFGSLMSSSGSFNQVRNMQDLLDCVQKLQSENQTLSQIFFKDKREREEYISQLGEEFDLQVREVEERANRRAREELESEKKRLREMMQTERETLQHHYKTIEQMSKLIKTPNGKLEGGETIDKVRSKLEDTFMENRQLKKSLHDTKTDVAMIWKEMEKLKRQYEDKLSNAYERNNETRNECDHIKQQLTLMKDSNRKLQDASDVITNYITDKVEPVIKGAVGGEEDSNYLSAAGGGPGSLSRCGSHNRLAGQSQSNSRRGSILSDYLGQDCFNLNESGGQVEPVVGSIKNNINENRTNANEANRVAPEERSAPAPATGISHRKSFKLEEALKKSRQQQQLEGLQDTSLSSTTESINKLESGTLETNLRDELEQSREKHLIGGPKCGSEQQQNETRDESQVQNEQLASNAKTNGGTSLRSIGRRFFSSSRAESDAQLERSKEDSSKSNRVDAKTIAKTGGQTMSLDSASIPVDANAEPTVEPADGPSKTTFNIILVGDSFVGKSSFAARFMEGNFVQGLISNCSIDFKTKAYKVDGVNYTVNLWDTAGQERFRSITASYFRKADGIILMYDVTDKRSYLNVRNWMSTISDTAAENVAVLLVGNKIDLRHTDNEEKCVPAEEGSRLAKEYDIVFLETSVKTGANLVPSMGKLIRLIARKNEPAEEDTDRIRLNDKSKTFNCMPKNC